MSAKSMLLRWVNAAAIVGLTTLLAGCSDRGSDHGGRDHETVGTVAEATFLNGDFEGANNGTPPPSWTVTPYLVANAGVTYPPQTFAHLNLGAGGNAATVTRGTAATVPESQTDPSLGSSASLRWPRFGGRAVTVNRSAMGNPPTQRNANSMKQTMTIVAGDIDPVDGKAHVRFTLAPVLENPSHEPQEQPFYFVQLRNLTKATVLYQDYNASAQPGVPWKVTGANLNYTDWQLVDVAPGDAALALGDQVELEVVASGCSLGGHWGYVWVDGVGSTIPGLFVKATGPSAQNAGSPITYTLTYTNGGTASASNVQVDFNTPPSTTWVGLNAPGLSCTQPSVGGTGLARCTIGNVAAGSSGSFQVTVNINPAATGIITNGNYSIFATGISPLLGPKVYTTVTSGVTYADLAVTMTNGAAGVAWGQPVSYTIVVTNNGPSAITGATLTDTIPAQLTGATWTCSASSGGSCPASGSGNINASVSLPAGGSATFVLNAAVVAGSGSGTVSNQATITLPGSASDTDTTNNTAVDTDSIGELRTVGLTKLGNGLGTVNSVPAAINCGGSCTSANGAFVQGTTVVLNAVAGVGDAFTSWGGACSGSSTSCTLVLNANVSVTATFAALPKPNGAACADGTGCTSGNCVDGACCNAPCGGGLGTDCQACNVAGSVGTCSPVAAGVVCRPTAGVCDQAESCNGKPLTCPADAFASNATECRAAAGACDQAESCTGSSASCPGDTFKSNLTVCRNATGLCDEEDLCTGSSADCPADSLKPSGTPCRAAAGICDVAETCSGSTGDCPADGFVGGGIQCRAASCADNTGTLAAACTGAGVGCPALMTVPCGAYECGGTACLTTCGANGDCAAGHYCDAGACLPQVGQGTACNHDDMCSTARCVDGVCCNGACDGQCEACNVEGSLGSCSPVTGAPRGVRAPCAGEGSACGGACDGSNPSTCAYPGTNSVCREGECEDGVATLEARCNGAGSCPALQTQDCAPYVCGVTTCAGDCSVDGDCVDTRYCSAGICVTKLTPGAACGGDNQCASNHCVDGVCCDTACTAQCEACNVAASLGTCSPVTGSPRAARTPCSSDGSDCEGACDGEMRDACAYPGEGVLCRAPSCTDGVATLVAGCNGAGACPAPTFQVCGAFACGENACNGECSVDGDCAAGRFCAAGVCITTRDPGSICTGGNQCTSGHCVDGVCCETACDGQCEACDVTASLGECVPVTGTPHGGRPACRGQGTCRGACDGEDTEACVYSGDETVCASPSCSNGVARAAATCDGEGSCESSVTTSCAPYVCAGDVCGTSCETRRDCTDGYVCVAGACVVGEPGTGGGGGTAGRGEAGEAGMAGEGGAAEGGTAGSGVAGNGGRGGSQAGGSSGGGPRNPGTIEGGGCSCRTTGSADSGHIPLAALAAALALGIARRRRSAHVNGET